MNEYIIIAKIKIHVRTKMDKEDTLEEFSSETSYNFDSTDNIEVTDTEYFDSEIIKKY